MFLCRIEEGGLSRDIWDFQVEHVSNVVSKMESRREGKVISEVCNYENMNGG